ncbi:MAG: hypothetical protein DHS20C18_21250 [Saprospiraceae bacterium]|nr:MAG: hypothetical protein DHS20C18_21250 [Saprospiraceae bacterium]
MTPHQVSVLIRKRRSIFPNTYNDRPIADEIIKEILENANWAPNHRHTEPWRFKIFTGAALGRLSTYMGDWYQKHTPADKFSAVKLKKTIEKPLRSACVIAICMQRDPAESLPEWEEIAAVACGVQNMWLTCAAYGIGCYWSSPKSMIEAGEWLGLKPGERCLGLFYMGYCDLPDLPGKRRPIEEKIEWK